VIGSVVINLLSILQNHHIDRVNHTNFLGVTIDEHLSWKIHITKVSGKLSRMCGILLRARQVLYGHTLISLYDALVKPHLIYCNVLWGNSYKTPLYKLHLMQKRILRIITFSEFHAHTRPIFINYDIMSVKFLSKYLSAIFVYKSINMKLPLTFCSLFTRNITSRTSCDLRIPFHRHKKTEHSILISGPRIWNKLTKLCKQSSSLHIFKKRLRRLLSIEFN